VYVGTGIVVMAPAVVRDRSILDRLVAILGTSENRQGNGLMRRIPNIIWLDL
jgi:hypothetical protein